MFWGQNVPSLKYAQFWNKLVSETCAIALVQADTQVNQFASGIDRAGNITNFTENRAGKVFSQDSKETYSLIFVSVIRKGNREWSKAFYYYYVFYYYYYILLLYVRYV